MCSICGRTSHEREACPHAVEIAEIRRMARLADYYLELVCPNYKNEISVTWRHNSHNPKNFCSGAYFLQMCRETIEWREKKNGSQ
jgi:hypothetical protein